MTTLTNHDAIVESKESKARTFNFLDPDSSVHVALVDPKLLWVN